MCPAGTQSVGQHAHGAGRALTWVMRALDRLQVPWAGSRGLGVP